MNKKFLKFVSQCLVRKTVKKMNLILILKLNDLNYTITHLQFTAFRERGHGTCKIWQTTAATDQFVF